MPPTPVIPEGVGEIRGEVRAFLEEERTAGRFTPSCDSWLVGWDESFSRALGARGWIGMTVPPRYGGGGLTSLERYAVTEELLAAGAPVAAHWIADRQIGPQLLRFGTEAQREEFLPLIARGECYFALGMSEPDSGSDLASVRTQAVRQADGWLLNGTKVWTSGAHHAHAIMVLARTSPVDTANRHGGLSQFIVRTDSPSVSVRPIRLISGEHHFNEVHFDGVAVPDSMVLGTIGEGWRQVTSELAFERSGPERFMSTYQLLSHVVEVVRETGADRHLAALGGSLARLWSLRQMSMTVAGSLDGDAAVDIPAALVKQHGTRFESEVIGLARLALDIAPDLTADEPGARLLAQAILQAPGFTIRGGTNEILQGVVARGLGLR
jgi:alkylation response protein AidB-like acyl-CoA dehydrogenase